MYLECGDCCQQTIISCGNDLARVSNKSPQTDSLTCEIFHALTVPFGSSGEVQLDRPLVLDPLVPCRSEDPFVLDPLDPRRSGDPLLPVPLDPLVPT